MHNERHSSIRCMRQGVRQFLLQVGGRGVNIRRESKLRGQNHRSKSGRCQSLAQPTQIQPAALQATDTAIISTDGEGTVSQTPSVDKPRNE